MLFVLLDCKSKTSVSEMASQESQPADNTNRILIRSNACSTFVEKKSSVGHVPHEPSKGAVVAVPVSTSTGTSTAAHGGHRSTARSNENKQKQSLSLKHVERDAISPVVQKDVVQLSLSLERGSDVTAGSSYLVAKSNAAEDFRGNNALLSHANTTQTFTPISLHESSSNASFSDLVEDNSDARLFPRTLLHHTDTVFAKNSTPASTSEDVQMLQTEVVSLKEQLVVQSKVCL